jgi:hypothetical protein
MTNLAPYNYVPDGWPENCPVPVAGYTFPSVPNLAKFFDLPYRQFTREEVSEMRGAWQAYVRARGFRLMWCAAPKDSSDGGTERV